MSTEPPFRARLAVSALVAAVAAAVLVWLAGCAPSGALEMHGKAAFWTWIAEHGITVRETDLTIIRGDVPGQVRQCGEWLAYSREVLYDDACIDDLYSTSPAVHEEVRTHEAAHALDDALGNPYKPPGVSYDGPALERGAQCITAVVLGRLLLTYDAINPSLGYWSCPEPERNLTRARMAAAGAW